VAAPGVVAVEGAMIDLNDIAPPRADGLIYEMATAVNDEGLIAGTASGPDGFPASPFLLIPEHD
jgi:hypothetical protein